MRSEPRYSNKHLHIHFLYARFDCVTLPQLPVADRTISRIKIEYKLSVTLTWVYEAKFGGTRYNLVTLIMSMSKSFVKLSRIKSLNHNKCIEAFPQFPELLFVHPGRIHLKKVRLEHLAVNMRTLCQIDAWSL